MIIDHKIFAIALAVAPKENKRRPCKLILLTTHKNANNMRKHHSYKYVRYTVDIIDIQIDIYNLSVLAIVNIL